MNEDIKSLKEKHKDFFTQIKGDFIKENDDFGNARRLEAALLKEKIKGLEDEEDKSRIMKEMISDYDGSFAYQQYLDDLDAPKRYLEKTYPRFYEYFKQKYEEFIETWMKEAESN